MDDLGLVPTDALIAELEARTDGGIIVYLRSERGSASSSYYYWGSFHGAIGLCEIFKADLLLNGDTRHGTPDSDAREE